MQEKRRHPRFRIDQMIEISFGKENYFTAMGVNLSEGGLLAQSLLPAEPSSRMFIMLSLDQGGPPISCEGIVVRSDQTAEGWNLGLKLVEMDPRDRERLNAFLSEADPIL